MKEVTNVQVMEKLDQIYVEVVSEIKELKQDVTDLKQDVTGLKQDVTDLKHDVTNIKQDVAEVKQDVTGLKQDVIEIKQGLNDFREEVASLGVFLQDQIDGLRTETRVGFARVDRRFDRLEGIMGNHETRLTRLERHPAGAY